MDLHPGRIGYHPNEFTPILSSISCPVELGMIPINGFTPNSTGHEILVKMGVNSLRFHLYAWLIELGIIPVIPTQFEGRSNSIPPVEFDRA